MSRPAALVLTGDLGMGHHMVSEVVADSLEHLGWRTEILDSMALLGPLASRAGEWAFQRLTASPPSHPSMTQRTSPICGPGADWPRPWTEPPPPG